MDVHSTEQRSRNMRAIKSRETKMEVFLGKKLWAQGLRYRKNYKLVVGKPDFAFVKYKIAVFVDSEFFHGKDWNRSKERIQTNRDFWWRKIEGNIDRDKIVNKTLRKNGWIVIRFWSSEVKKDAERCVLKVIKSIELRGNAGKV